MAGVTTDAPSNSTLLWCMCHYQSGQRSTRIAWSYSAPSGLRSSAPALLQTMTGGQSTGPLATQVTGPRLGSRTMSPAGRLMASAENQATQLAAAARHQAAGSLRQQTGMLSPRQMPSVPATASTTHQAAGPWALQGPGRSSGTGSRSHTCRQQQETGTTGRVQQAAGMSMLLLVAGT